MKDLIHNTKRETLKEIPPLSEAYMKLEKCRARLTAADALAKMLTSNHVVSILALLTDIAFSCDKINKNEYKEHMETARKLSDALREYREVSGG